MATRSSFLGPARPVCAPLLSRSSSNWNDSSWIDTTLCVPVMGDRLDPGATLSHSSSSSSPPPPSSDAAAAAALLLLLLLLPPVLVLRRRSPVAAPPPLPGGPPLAPAARRSDMGSEQSSVAAAFSRKRLRVILCRKLDRHPSRASSTMSRAFMRTPAAL